MLYYCLSLSRTTPEHRLIHERLLAKQPSAPAVAVDKLLPEVISHIRQAMGNVDRDTLDACAVDAVLDYVQNPERVDPDRVGLLNFLRFAARRNVLNELGKVKRRGQRETQLECVELVAVGGNISREYEGETCLTEQHMTALLRAFPEESERSALELVLDGERSTAAYAAVLQLTYETCDDIPREVKRVKDRVLKRLARLKEKLHD